MKKQIASMLLAAAAVLGLCTPALAAPAKSARCWKVYVEHSSIYWQGSKAAEPDAKAPVWQPAWLPEGWTLEYGAARDGVWPETNWVYRCGEETLSMSLCAPSDFGFCQWMDFEDGKTAKKELKIQGYPADFWQMNQRAALAWEDARGNLFVLLHSGSLTQAEIEKVANSVAELRAPLPDYRLGWTPAQDGEIYRDTTMPGYVSDSGGPPDIRFLYAGQPLSAPERMPETVTVRGVPARLWLGDPKETGIIVTSPVSGRTAEIPTEKTWSTLMWTDPETDICFRIQGNKLTKETMLRMAESVETGRAASWPAQPAANPASASSVPVSGSGGSNASRRSWAADGWKAVIVQADGTVENVPNCSELFPGQELPAV